MLPSILFLATSVNSPFTSVVLRINPEVDCLSKTVITGSMTKTL
jgi:hypothetical protein